MKPNILPMQYLNCHFLWFIIVLVPRFIIFFQLIFAALTALVFSPSCLTPENSDPISLWLFSWAKFCFVSQVQFHLNRFLLLCVVLVHLHWQTTIIEKAETVDMNSVSLFIFCFFSCGIFGCLGLRNMVLNLLAKTGVTVVWEEKYSLQNLSLLVP